MRSKAIGLVSDICPLAGLDVLKKIYAYAAEKYGTHAIYGGQRGEEINYD